MKDLTEGSIDRHLVALASPYVVGLLTHIAYQLVDLYFITRIGAAATAGVNAAGNALLVTAALAQVVTVGTIPPIAHALGRKDQGGARAVFNQSLLLSVVLAALTVAMLWAATPAYMQAVAADVATARAGSTFMLWMLPGIALTFPMAALSAALRAMGVVRPIIVISTATVVLNAMLAPVLIGGWGTGIPMGVQGAGLASSVSTLAGVLLLCAYFCSEKRYLRISLDLMRPQLLLWGRFASVGLPAGVEFVLTFLSTAVVYYTIRDFGVTAQAGFSIGSQLLQILLVPGLAIGFAAGPIAAQNFGAVKSRRVRETFQRAAFLSSCVMAILTVIAQQWPRALVGVFDADATALAIAAMFLQSMSWTFVAQGLAYTCSNMFEGLGNTLPLLISSSTRFLTFLIAALVLARRPAFDLEHLWHLLNASIVLQALLSLWLLRIELRKRLVEPGLVEPVAG
jgi:putative MATE family efflux protein